MSCLSNNQGRAYEYICLITLYQAIKEVRPVKVLNNSSYKAAQKAWDTLKSAKQVLYTLSAKSTINTIFALEPNIVEKSEDVLSLYIQADKKGEAADVRDIIIERKDIVWEIGLSIKHNHMAVKHSRISNRLDFGKKWYGVKCSETYWKDVQHVFKLLQEEKKKKTLFESYPSKIDDIYVPLLNAFKKEITTQIEKDKSIPQKLVEYLLSKFDFYKVISIDSRKITTIQSFNMYGTLNKPSREKEPEIKVPQINLPSELLYIDFKKDNKTTIIMCLDNGWQFSFRLHNAEKIMCPSLKFDIQIEGMPADVNVKFNCKW